jgi:PTH1 family peptidyl-tRNA hydrolase
MVLDRLAESRGGRFKPGFGPYDLCSMALGREKVLLVKPTTYMNRSGIAVDDAIKRYDVPLSRVVVVCDDFNLPVGKIRLRMKGSAGGHQGLVSVIRFWGSQEFARIRLGIGLEPEADVVSYVLSRFSRKEKSAVNEMVETGAEILADIPESGFERVMNLYNR